MVVKTDTRVQDVVLNNLVHTAKKQAELEIYANVESDDNKNKLRSTRWLSKWQKQIKILLVMTRVFEF